MEHFSQLISDPGENLFQGLCNVVEGKWTVLKLSRDDSGGRGGHDIIMTK